MIETIKRLGEEQIGFICHECSLSEDELFEMSEDELYDSVFEVMCDIEIEEVSVNDGEEETERCILASDIVTELSKAIAEREEFSGYYEDETAV